MPPDYCARVPGDRAKAVGPSCSPESGGAAAGATRGRGTIAARSGCVPSAEHSEFPVLDELSPGDTQERTSVYRRGADADRQDPGPHGQRALCVHRAQEEVGRATGKPLETPGSRERRPRLAITCGEGASTPVTGNSPFPVFLVSWNCSEMGAPSFSDAEPWLPLSSLSSSCPHRSVVTASCVWWMLISFPAAALSLCLLCLSRSLP